MLPVICGGVEEGMAHLPADVPFGILRHREQTRKVLHLGCGAVSTISGIPLRPAAVC